MGTEIEREIARLSNLINYKDMSENDLQPIARINVEMRNFKKAPLFQKEEEQLLAEEKFRNYLENSETESTSDIDTLRSLVYLEVQEKRLQKKLNDLNEENKYPPEHLTKQLVNIQNQKSSLKVKLGIDRKDEEKDDLSALQLLEKRVLKYIQEHPDEFTLYIPWTCEKCGHKDIEPYLIYKRTTDMTAIKHPWFAGRWLFNYEIMKDVKEGKLSKEDAIRFTLCAGQGLDYKIPEDVKKYCSDYIDLCLENWTEITDLLRKT